jgi:hypothetical protein
MHRLYIYSTTPAYGHPFYIEGEFHLLPSTFYLLPHTFYLLLFTTKK